MGVKRMGSDTELIGVQEALNFVAQSSSVSSTLGAVAVPSVRDRSMSLQPAASAIKFFTKPISWEENAVANQHIFHEVDTREACYFTDSIHCQVHIYYIHTSSVVCIVLSHTSPPLITQH
ncbi:hypothetical protein GBAR_LOCUS8708 [Geodia barretti]|uniref:Uncharacterized protein n=1 Tax=Geodia barretti TaxID=519541 RepID=A0AA35RP55_GEOBA|nr:hypothetical protein GBAR_LOCUS8708 [Geodia barretti]